MRIQERKVLAINQTKNLSPGTRMTNRVMQALELVNSNLKI